MRHPASRLESLGWDSYFDEKFKQVDEDGVVPARVVADYGAEYVAHDGVQPRRAVAGRHLRNDGLTLPAVGDWVAILRRDPLDVIRVVIERRTVFS